MVGQHDPEPFLFRFFAYAHYFMAQVNIWPFLFLQLLLCLNVKNRWVVLLIPGLSAAGLLAGFIFTIVCDLGAGGLLLMILSVAFFSLPLIGSLLGLAVWSVLRRLGCFGETLGILFQLHDDLLDFSGREAGKETHRDFQDGIYTLPVLLALQSSGGRAALLPLMRGSRERQLTGDELRRMEREVVRHGGVEQSWAVICRYLETGGALLDTFEDGEPLRTLRKVWCQLGRR